MSEKRPQKLPPRKPAQAQQKPSPNGSVTANRPVNEKKPENQQPATSAPQQVIPEKDIKQSSSINATAALEAGKKAFELRQAAYAAGDPDAREEILAKAVNKEIEAETFGKAAKYTRSGAFQGLAAGAGIGIVPGVTIGKITGAIVGGLLASVGALLGGGIGSAYGAISGPMWDIGGMAAHGVRGVVGNFIGDWPDFGPSTKNQRDTLEKMVLGAKNTKTPSQSELEEMRDDNGGASQESYMQMAKDMSSYLPNKESLPNFETFSRNIPSWNGMKGKIPSVPSIPGFGGQQISSQDAAKGTSPSQQQTSKSKPQISAQGPPKPREPPVPREPPQQPSTASSGEKRKPKKLEIRSNINKAGSSKSSTPMDKAPPKLESRRQVAA